MADRGRRAPEGLTIARATEEDIPAIKAMVDSAYSKYIERIGKPPAPMSADWKGLIRSPGVWVLRTTEGGGGQEVVGGVVLGVDAASDSVKVNNLVVSPAAQGRGYGKILMGFAEDTARAEGRPALTLFTNLMMRENLVLYPKLGFHETGRRTEDGYDRVYYRKDLA